MAYSLVLTKVILRSLYGLVLVKKDYPSVNISAQSLSGP